MTAPTRLERNLTGILDDLSAGPTPDYLDDLFVRTGRMRQRPPWTFPERWLPMTDITRSRAFAFAPPLRSIALALVVIALVAAAALAYVGTQRRVPAPFGPAANGLIVYDNGGDIYTGDPVTGAERLVVGGKDFDAEPGFSPDGTLIAFIRQSDSDVDLYTVRPDGSDLKRVTTSAIPSDSWVNWAPDSRHLGVVHLENGHKRFDVLGFDGTSPRRLAGDMEIDSFTYRPPLAQEILLRAVVDGHLGLFAMDADGTNIRPLITTSRPPDNPLDFGGATYSADGTRIFYQSWTPPGFQPEGCCNLWVMDADGSNPHVFVNDAANRWEGQAAVSPDGQWVAFWRVVDTSQVSIIRADGSGPVTKIGPNLTGTAVWGWAPDSSKILMVTSDAADSPGQYLLDPAGGPWTRTAWQATSNPDWQRLAP